MNKAERINKATAYWQAVAKHDHQTMIALFKSKRYSDSLFFGHIVLEKTLKALVVQNTEKEAPKTHDLLRLSELAYLDLPKETFTYLKVVNRFNMRARYPDTKLKFYKLCTRAYAEENLKKIKDIYYKLCQKLK